MKLVNTVKSSLATMQSSVGSMVPKKTAQKMYSLLPEIVAGAVLCAPLVLLPPTFAQAQSRHVEHIRARLQEATALFGDAGYSATHDPYINSLNDGHFRTSTLTLQKGVTYSILGVCDEDCADIDLVLFDENQNRIDADSLANAYPMLEVTPRWTGTFTIRAEMHDCAYSPCYYGIGVFGEN